MYVTVSTKLCAFEGSSIDIIDIITSHRSVFNVLGEKNVDLRWQTLRREDINNEHNFKGDVTVACT